MATLIFAEMMQGEYQSFAQIIPGLPPTYDEWSWQSTKEKAQCQGSGHLAMPVSIRFAAFHAAVEAKSVEASLSGMREFAGRTSAAD